MTPTAVVVALAGSVFLAFVAPYVLAPFGMTPNGTETALLVVALWAACWSASRLSARRRGTDSIRP